MAHHMLFCWAGNLPKQNRLLSKPAVGKIVYFLLIYLVLACRMPRSKFYIVFGEISDSELVQKTMSQKWPSGCMG